MKKVETTDLAVKQEETFELAPTAESAAVQHEIQSAIVIAQRFRRNEDAAYQKLMKAAGRSSFAEEALYSFPRGGATVEGPSVNMAREAARVWGNIRYGVDIIRDDDESRHIRAWAWDIESNTKTTQEDNFKKLIFRKDKGWIAPDERDLRELTNRRGAIALRNCLLNLIPKDVVEDAIAEVKRTLARESKVDPDSSRKKIVTAFSGIGVTVEALETKLGHPISQCSPDEVAELRGVFKSIQDGNSKWADYIAGGAKDEATGLKRPAKKTNGNGDASGEGGPVNRTAKDIFFAAGKQGWTEESLKTLMKDEYKTEDSKSLSQEQLNAMYEIVTKVKAPV